MTGSAAERNMQGFDFTDTWKTIPNDYPILSWESLRENTVSEENENQQQDSNTENSSNEETTQDSDLGTSNDSDTEEPSENAEEEGMPGFTVVGAVIALLGAAFLLKNE
jgi:PGF-CTERM protein